MLFSKLETFGDSGFWSYEDENEEFAEHRSLQNRLRKTMYFGKTSRMEQTSLPMTELAVEYFQESIPRQLGRVDLEWASSFTRKTSVSPCAMMLGMLYIERLRHKNPDYLEKMSSEDLFLISMMLASKYLYDEGGPEEMYNDEWADTVNMDPEDINELEVDFLRAIDWNLFVGDKDFMDLLLGTEHRIAVKETRRRGFLTYTDFWILLQHKQLLSNLWQVTAELCQILAICSFAYTASVLTVTALSMSPAHLATQDCRLNHSLDRVPLFSVPGRPHEIDSSLCDDALKVSDDILNSQHDEITRERVQPLGATSRPDGQSETTNDRGRMQAKRSHSPGSGAQKKSGKEVAMDSVITRKGSSSIPAMVSQFMSLTFLRETLASSLSYVMDTKTDFGLTKTSQGPTTVPRPCTSQNCPNVAADSAPENQTDSTPQTNADDETTSEGQGQGMCQNCEQHHAKTKYPADPLAKSCYKSNLCYFDIRTASRDVLGNNQWNKPILVS